MDRALLIIYEPALFLLAALGWAGWELWSLRTKKGPTPPADPPPPSAEAPGHAVGKHGLDDG